MPGNVNTTIMEIILLDFLMFYQIFCSPQVKWSAISSNKQGVYKLPHKLLKDLRLKKSGKSQHLLELISLPVKMKIF